MLKLIFLALILAACTDPEEQPCFSPSKNLESAYENGAEGCPCDTLSDIAQCIKDKNGVNVALICENSRWMAVEDGPCALLP